MGPLADPDGVVVGTDAAAPSRTRTAQVAKAQKPGLLGTQIVYQPYKKPDGGSYPNFTMFCSRHAPPCTKTKGLTPTNIKSFGRIEPLCFLHAWDGYDDPDGQKPHGLANPPKHLVAAMAAAHGPEIQRIMDGFGL